MAMRASCLEYLSCCGRRHPKLGRVRNTQDEVTKSKTNTKTKTHTNTNTNTKTHTKTSTKTFCGRRHPKLCRVSHTQDEVTTITSRPAGSALSHTILDLKHNTKTDMGITYQSGGSVEIKSLANMAPPIPHHHLPAIMSKSMCMFTFWGPKN